MGILFLLSTVMVRSASCLPPSALSVPTGGPGLVLRRALRPYRRGHTQGRVRVALRGRGGARQAQGRTQRAVNGPACSLCLTSSVTCKIPASLRRSFAALFACPARAMRCRRCRVRSFCIYASAGASEQCTTSVTRLLSGATRRAPTARKASVCKAKPSCPATLGPDALASTQFLRLVTHLPQVHAQYTHPRLQKKHRSQNAALGPGLPREPRPWPQLRRSGARTTLSARILACSRTIHQHQSALRLVGVGAIGWSTSTGREGKGCESPRTD